MPTGKNKVPMARLREILAESGFHNVRTYIASGNVLVDTELSEEQTAKEIHNLIKKHIGPEIDVIIRSKIELESVLKVNPFPDGAPNHVLVIFFPMPVSKQFSEGVSTPGREKVVILKKEVYVHYIDGVGQSKLKLPKETRTGTARNINTIKKLIEMAGQR